MNGDVPIAVVLVDDVEVVRDVARLELEVDGGFRIVGEAACGRDLLALTDALAEAPDAVVLDYRMPGMAFDDVFERLQQRWPLVRVVVFTATPAEVAIDRHGWGSRIVVLPKSRALAELPGVLRDLVSDR